MNNNFFAMMFRMKYINRWGLMRSNIIENLSMHSMETALIAHALAEIGNNYFDKNYNSEKIAIKALFHDAPEILTGDLATPVKNHSQAMRDAYKIVENAALDRFIELVPEKMRDSYAELFELTHDEKLLIKAADKLCAYIKCIEETQSGNKEFSSAMESLRKALDTMQLDELKYFIDNFLDGFYLPLDTLRSIDQ
ncbi:MAG: 5'-deoxynucleotidase [Clostridiales bacterium GWF2_38_85]|nr:MAG: 5'-deoxynucleotidase [Clostridiales bacterium GWF2_38_85]